VFSSDIGRQIANNFLKLGQLGGKIVRIFGVEAAAISDVKKNSESI
jgi:predicted NUDIX family NTP pyrophosphohydrolase